MSAQCSRAIIDSVAPFSCRLHFNRSTGEYRNTQGVETRVPGFGNTSCVENLDPTAPFLSKTSYFDLLVDHFVELGYERGKSIRAAPYDWRLAVGMKTIWHPCLGM